jgi:hypothetical protein
LKTLIFLEGSYSDRVAHSIALTFCSENDRVSRLTVKIIEDAVENRNRGSWKIDNALPDGLKMRTELIFRLAGSHSAMAS